MPRFWFLEIEEDSAVPTKKAWVNPNRDDAHHGRPRGCCGGGGRAHHRVPHLRRGVRAALQELRHQGMLQLQGILQESPPKDEVLL